MCSNVQGTARPSHAPPPPNRYRSQLRRLGRDGPLPRSCSVSHCVSEPYRSGWQAVRLQMCSTVVMSRSCATATHQDFESTYRFTEPDRRRVMFLDQRDFFQTVGVIILPKRFPTETAQQTITMRIFDDNGQQILLEQRRMAPGTSRLINYAVEYSQTIGVRGNIEVHGVLIDILFTGIRINASGSFTPMQSYAPQGS